MYIHYIPKRIGNIRYVDARDSNYAVGVAGTGGLSKTALSVYLLTTPIELDKRREVTSGEADSERDQADQTEPREQVRNSEVNC